MSMKSKLIGFAAIGLTLAAMGEGNPSRRLVESKETEQERKDRLAKAEIERNIRNGLKLFTYHNNG